MGSLDACQVCIGVHLMLLEEAVHIHCIRPASSKGSSASAAAKKEQSESLPSGQLLMTARCCPAPPPPPRCACLPDGGVRGDVASAKGVRGAGSCGCSGGRGGLRWGGVGRKRCRRPSGSSWLWCVHKPWRRPPLRPSWGSSKAPCNAHAAPGWVAAAAGRVRAQQQHLGPRAAIRADCLSLHHGGCRLLFVGRPEEAVTGETQGIEALPVESAPCQQAHRGGV